MPQRPPGMGRAGRSIRLRVRRFLVTQVRFLITNKAVILSEAGRAFATCAVEGPAVVFLVMRADQDSITLHTD
jgi:hypothetical protein